MTHITIFQAYQALITECSVLPGGWRAVPYIGTKWKFHHDSWRVKSVLFTKDCGAMNTKKNQPVADPILIQAVLLAARATILFNYPFTVQSSSSPLNPCTAQQLVPTRHISSSLGEEQHRSISPLPYWVSNNCYRMTSTAGKKKKSQLKFRLRKGI